MVIRQVLGALLFSLLVSWATPGEAMEASPVKTFPKWDGRESIKEYAQRNGLQSTKVLHFKDGISLELILIPAGEFVMGSAPPSPIDGAACEMVSTYKIGAILGLVVFLTLLAYVFVAAIVRRGKVQISLLRLVVLTLSSSAVLLCYLGERTAQRGIQIAIEEQERVKERFLVADITEKPARTIVISRPFYLGIYETTQEQYELIMGEITSHFRGNRMPVDNIDWENAVLFCTKLSSECGENICLPTEAEWEFACRAGTNTLFYSGDSYENLGEVGWFDKNSSETSHPVGEKLPNAFGLFDMHGNVSEWCADVFDPEYFYKVDSIDPNSATGIDNVHVQRGGCFRDDNYFCRAACRIGGKGCSGIRLKCEVR